MNFLEEFKAFSEDPSDIGHRSALFRLVLVGILFLVIAIGLVVYEWKDKTPILEEVQNKEATLMQSFRVKHKKAVNLEAYKKQLADMEITFEGMLNQLPGKTEIDDLLEDISNAGVGSGLEQKVFKPNPEIRRDFYAELPITIRLTGDYHQMADFASRVAALPRIVTLHDFSISGQDDKLSMDILAKTYRYLEDDEVN